MLLLLLSDFINCRNLHAYCRFGLPWTELATALVEFTDQLASYFLEA